MHRRTYLGKRRGKVRRDGLERELWCAEACFSHRPCKRCGRARARTTRPCCCPDQARDKRDSPRLRGSTLVTPMTSKANLPPPPSTLFSQYPSSLPCRGNRDSNNNPLKWLLLSAHERTLFSSGRFMPNPNGSGNVVFLPVSAPRYCGEQNVTCILCVVGVLCCRCCPVASVSVRGGVE